MTHIPIAAPASLVGFTKKYLAEPVFVSKVNLRDHFLTHQSSIVKNKQEIILALDMFKTPTLGMPLYLWLTRLLILTSNPNVAP